MRRPAWRQAATSLFAVLSGLSFVVAGYLTIAYPVPGEPDTGFVLLWVLAGPVPFFVVGVAGHWRGPPACHLAAPLLWVGGAGGITAAFGRSLRVADRIGIEGGLLIAATLGYLLASTVAMVLLARTLALLPDGHYRHRYERVILHALWALPLLAVIVFFAGPIDQLDQGTLFESSGLVPGPLPALPWLTGPVGVAYQYYFLPMLVGPALFLVRVVRMTAAERRVIRAILVVVVLMMVELVAIAVFCLWLAETTPAVLVQNGVIGMVPIIAIVVLAAVIVHGIRNGILGVGVATRRTLVYAGLWTMIAVAYLGVATALGLAASERLPIVIAILITVAGTIILEPVRRWVNKIAERQVFGHRLSGYELLVRMGGTLEHASQPRELAEELAGGVRDGLGLDWATVRLDRFVATAGTIAGDPAVERPVRHGDVEFGMINCGPKLDGPFLPRDLELVETLARQAALALHNAQQTVELEASRARIVQAQDAERRRIEQDLHDGVQQELVALVAKLGLARSTLSRDPGRSLQLIDELRGEAVRIVDELRELAHGIHPSVLTDDGLVAAVESSARRMPIPVAMSIQDRLRDFRFPVAVEESAFYFVAESLTNVLKHAGATEAAISLAATNGSLLVEVRDNGIGLPPAIRSGGGLTALRDRIAAVGGSVQAGNGAGAGAVVHARLPSADGTSPRIVIADAAVDHPPGAVGSTARIAAPPVAPLRTAIEPPTA